MKNKPTQEDKEKNVMDSLYSHSGTWLYGALFTTIRMDLVSKGYLRYIKKDVYDITDLGKKEFKLK